MRFIASFNFLFAIGAFFLPWIDIRCEVKKGDSYGLLTQSGYEIATGEATEGDAKERIEKQMKDMGMPVNQKQPQGAGMGPKIEKGNIEKAPVLWGFVGALGAGAVLCLILPGNLWRIGAAIAMVGALGVLGYQMNEGFPAAKKVQAAQAEIDAMKANAGQAPGGMKVQAMPGMDFDPRYFVVYKPGFYLAWALAALPLLWILIDVMTAAPPRRPYAADERADGRTPFDDD